MKAITNGVLIDGTGSDPVTNATVIIDDDGRIQSVGTATDPPRGAEVIDASGRTIMPGLTDCHVHFFLQFGPMQEAALTPLTTRVFEAADRATKTLDAGITSVRDTGFTPRGFKLAAQRGLIQTPRINTAVNALSQTGGHTDFELPGGIGHPWVSTLFDYPTEWPNQVCDGPEGVTKAAREVLKAGADFIKICTTGGVSSPEDEPWHTQFTEEEIRAIVYEANARGTYVAAHAQGLQGIKNAVQNGVRTIEHGIYIDEETAVNMANRNVYLVPTFHAPQGVLKAEEANPGSILPQSLRKTREVIEDHKKNIRMAIEKGVKVAMGTDAGVGLHGTNAEELTYLVELGGMTPMQAIVAATKTASECNRMDADVGTLEPGKFADLLVVDGDPTADISTLEDKSNLLMVMQGGSAHKDLISD